MPNRHDSDDVFFLVGFLLAGLSLVLIIIMGMIT